MLRIICSAAVLLASAGAASADSRLAIDVRDLASREGAAAFDRDVMRAARRLCQRYSGVARIRCLAGVRDEALEKLPQSARLTYAQARARAG
ncbi:hypothetical protein [Brevundimonas naejangsanensis]|uniref:hypothetical protein n=1 Tax=Brevundimonas naejangsanensis TaxID=588932 RepID=UPI00106B4271|nr:hypothetical protein [Brevundimonas naejangsanensis]QBQ49294.1 hypothetical protein E3U41_11725 [Brevundimonas naejangsanensis]